MTSEELKKLMREETAEIDRHDLRGKPCVWCGLLVAAIGLAIVGNLIWDTAQLAWALWRAYAG